jgi:hypothetical protein
MAGRCGLRRGACRTHNLPQTSLIQHTMKTFKSLVSAFLIVAFLGSIAGCDRFGSHGKDGGHGHSHE